MRVQMIVRAGRAPTGTGRYSGELRRALQAAGLDVCQTRAAGPPAPPCVSNALKRGGMDLDAFFDSYPVRAGIERADVYHLTCQTQATLLLFQRFPGPTVVTVLDVIPWLVRRDPELNTLRHPVDVLFYHLALMGLRRATTLIAISEYTRQTLLQVLGLPRERIHVVYPTVDLSRFRPMAVPQELRRRYALGEDERHVLFVGSDDPRKNLPMLLRAFAEVRRRVPRARLLKVGAGQIAGQRQKLLTLIAELGLEGTVRFFDQIPDDDLPLFYNAADVLVMPSRYEGFGLPALEAMACGRPVLVSNAEPLLEIVGGTLSPVPPDIHAWAESICGELEGRAHAGPRRELLDRASEFSGARAAERVLSVYKALLGQPG